MLCLRALGALHPRRGKLDLADSIDPQKVELADSPVVRQYLAGMNRAE
jgi:hypothetical protein